jgi:hypothetical protein
VILIATRKRGFAFEGQLQHETWVPTLLMCVAAAAMLYVTAYVPLHDYDGRSFWLLKAKAIAHEGVIGGPFFQTVDPDPSYYRLRIPPNSHNRYPLLIPLDAATIFVAARSLDDRHIRWLYALIPIAFAFDIRRRFGRLFTPATGAWFGTLFLWTPAIALDDSGSAMTAYCDLALAAFAGCAVFELFEGVSPLRTGFWIACALLTKDEGLIFAPVLFLVAMAVFRRRVAPAVVLVAIAAATLFAWRSMVPLTDLEHLASRVSALPSRAGALLHALGRFAGYAAHGAEWGFFWLAFVAALLVLIWRRDWRVTLICGFVIASMTLAYCVVYAVSAYDMAILIKVSAMRLLMHLTGPALLLMACASTSKRSA